MTSVFNHPFLTGLFNDPEVARFWEARAQVDHYMAFEAALAEALEETGEVPEGTGAAAAKAIRGTDVEIDTLDAGTATDGVPIPALVRALREASPHPEAVHTGATSQDVMDTALALTLGNVTATLVSRIETLSAKLDEASVRFGQAPLMGRTRMQAALPIRVADRISSWRSPLAGHLDRFAALREATEVLQLGGPVGTREPWGDAADRITMSMANALSLRAPEHVWHSDRTALADYANALSLVTGTLGKMGQDVCLMSQQGVDEIRLGGGGGSSAMPHKSNPVTAELLVTLARFNAAQLGAMHQTVVHEQERSGASWMLEWMTLGPMTVATARALAVGIDLVGRIESMGTPPAD